MSRLAILLAAVGLALMTWSERALVGAPSLLPLFETPEGQRLLYLWIALGVCAVVVVAVEFVPGRAMLWLLGAAGAAAMLVPCVSGHADAPSAWRVADIIVQWVHMSAIGVWVGGLAWLLLGIRGMDREARAAAVAAFSRVATITLVVVLATGLIRGLKEVGSIGALFDTTYGITVLVKIGLVIVLVGLGALNHFRWTPALRSRDGAVRSFRLNSTGELALAAGVLLATAILTGLAPAAQAAATTKQEAARVPVRAVTAAVIRPPAQLAAAALSGRPLRPVHTEDVQDGS